MVRSAIPARAALRILGLLPGAALATAAEAERGLAFIGRFHPTVVHLPIGLLIAVALVEARTCWIGARQPDAARGILLWAAALGAGVAVGLGLALAAGGGYAADALAWHQWLGIALAVVSAGLVALHHLEWRHARLRPLFRVALAGAIALLVLAGHAGGTLTHGEGYLIRHAPTWLGGEPPRARTPAPVEPAAEPATGGSATVAPEMLPEPTMDSAPAPEAPPPRDAAEPAAVPGDAPDYQRDIRPILEARCSECHGATKQKGGLRLDSLAAIRAGGERAVLVPGDPERSPLYTTLILPADDPDLMPARGGPLDPAQIALIRAWIAAGAPSADESGAALPAPDQPKAKRAAAPPATLYDQLAIGLPAPDPATIATLTAAGAVVTPLSRDGALLEVNLAHTRAPLAAAHLQPLARIAANLAWLDLGGTAVSDALLSHLRPLRNLRRLHLERTAVGDAGLVHLLGLAHLDYLNLVGTRVSDAGLYRLHALKRLERVYLWQSKVTPAGAAKLRAALPQAQVDLGQ